LYAAAPGHASGIANMSQPCDRACLLDTGRAFVTKALAGDLESISLSSDAEVRENAHALRLTESAWSKVKVVRDQMMFVDPITGNILVRAGVELNAGTPAYLSTRIRVNSSAQITDVEIVSDQSENVVTDYVWNLNPIYTETLPAHQRIERVEMEAIVRRYFNALDSHLPVQSDFDNGVCNRFHSGWQVTNVELNAVEGGSMLTCVSSMEGTPPWGPATEQRIMNVKTMIDLNRPLLPLSATT